MKKNENCKYHLVSWYKYRQASISHIYSQLCSTYLHLHVEDKSLSHELEKLLSSTFNVHLAGVGVQVDEKMDVSWVLDSSKVHVENASSEVASVKRYEWFL